jgi:transketolase
LEIFGEQFRKEWKDIKEEKIVEFKLENVVIQISNMNDLIVQRWERTLKKLSKKERQRYNDIFKEKERKIREQKKQDLKLSGVLEKHQEEISKKCEEFIKETEKVHLRKAREDLIMLKEKGKRLIEANNDIIEENERRKKTFEKEDVLME